MTSLLETRYVWYHGSLSVGFRIKQGFLESSVLGTVPRRILLLHMHFKFAAMLIRLMMKWDIFLF